MDRQGKAANRARGQLNRRKFILPRPHSRLRIWARETGSAVPSRISQLVLHTQVESGAYSRAPLLPPTFRDDVHLYRQAPLDHAIVYRWRSPPRVHRHRASSPQGSSSNGCCLLRRPHGPNFVRLYSHTSPINIGTVCMVIT